MSKTVTYKVFIKPKSSSLTPFESDTLFGHICWVIRYIEGEDYLRLFLEEIENGGIFLISSGFPGGYLPKPVLPSTLKKDEQGSIQDHERTKKIKKVIFISEKVFEQHKNSGFNNEEDIYNYLDDKNFCLTEDDVYNFQTVIKNTINRNSFTTIDHLLFSHKEIYYNKRLQIFYRSNFIGIEEFIRYLKYVGEEGFGKRASTGKGHFEVEGYEETILPEADSPNAFMSLSNYVPFEGEPREGWYEVFTKWGKVGREFSMIKCPFKKPILMFKPGSIFKIQGELKQSYGGLIKNVSNAWQDVCQYVIGFPLGVRVKHE